MLKVRTQTPTLAVYGELGQYPINLRLQSNILKYLHRAHNMPASSLVNRIYIMLGRYKDKGKVNWLSRALTVYDSFSTTVDMSLDIFMSKPKPYVKSFVKNQLHKMFESEWLKSISDIDANPKLRTYCRFKSVLELEPYLGLTIPNHRKALAKFRCSAHHLAIETGRHHKPKQPLEKRLCPTCNTLEDEQHHLITCLKNKTAHIELFNTARSYIDNFNDMDASSKFPKTLDM